MKVNEKQIVSHLIIALRNIMMECSLGRTPYVNPKNERRWMARMKSAEQAIMKAKELQRKRSLDLKTTTWQ